MAPSAPCWSPSVSSSSLLNIISGLLVNVAMELAVFLRGDGCVAGTSFSLLNEFRESQEKGPVSFRAGGGGAVDDVAGGGGGGATAEAGGIGLRDGDSAEGDHGIDGRALVMLLRDIVLLGGSFSTGFLGSLCRQLIGTRYTCYAGWRGTKVPSVGGASSSKLTLSRLEVLEIRLE